MMSVLFLQTMEFKKLELKKKISFITPKGQGQGIMTSEFFLPYGRLNLASLIPEKREKVIQESRL